MVGSRGTRDISLWVCFCVSRGVRQGVGGYCYWRWRVPELPGARFWFRPIFGYEEGPRGRRLLRLETEEGPRGRRWPTAPTAPTRMLCTLIPGVQHGGPALAPGTAMRHALTPMRARNGECNELAQARMLSTGDGSLSATRDLRIFAHPPPLAIKRIEPQLSRHARNACGFLLHVTHSRRRYRAPPLWPLASRRALSAPAHTAEHAQ